MASSVNPPNAPLGNNPQVEDGLHLSARMREALLVLREAYEYAQDLDTTAWDFATEIASLRRLKLSNSDLRWLVGRGLIEHGVEVTLGGDEQRSFQHPTRLILSRRTCFVLSRAGAELAYQLARGGDFAAAAPRRAEPPALVIASPPALVPPKWDRDRQELRVGATVVRCFKIPSPDEEAILAAFEEAGWPARIDNPLPSTDEHAHKWRLQQAIELLNRNQRPSLVRLLADPTGRGVCWEFCGQWASLHDA